VACSADAMTKRDISGGGDVHTGGWVDRTPNRWSEAPTALFERHDTLARMHGLEPGRRR
jgi:hypothetical protein